MFVPGPTRNDKHVIWAPLEDLIADDRFAASLQTAIGGARRVAMTLGVLTWAQQLHKEGHGRSDGLAVDRVRVLKHDPVVWTALIFAQPVERFFGVLPSIEKHWCRKAATPLMTNES